MRTVDKLTDDHATEPTTGNNNLSNDHSQANLSEQLKETVPTSSNSYDNIIISPLERQALQDHHHSTDVSKWNDVHDGTHRDFSNIPSTEKQALQDLPMAHTGTTADPPLLLEPTGASTTLL